jgi:hypothetical protein
MILRRLTANLRAQNWTAITIEFLIVVIGVFVGTQVSNWNDERIQRAQTTQVLQGLKPELRNLIGNFETLRAYYAITKNYSRTAFAGWRGDPRVSDRDFVIAAYQASQNTFTGVENNSWSEIFGADRMRDLKDQRLHDQLSILMTTDFTTFERELFTPYREDVRKVIPEDVQDAIRAQCGDRRVGLLGYVALPPSCNLDLPNERFTTAAKALREHPELIGEMRWHFAAVASYVDNITNLEAISREVIKRIDGSKG